MIIMKTDWESSLIAAIDIGSNSIKMTVGRANASGGVDEVDWASETVRLGQGLDSTGKLSDSRMDAAVETLNRFRQRAEQVGAANRRRRHRGDPSRGQWTSLSAARSGRSGSPDPSNRRRR